MLDRVRLRTPSPEVFWPAEPPYDSALSISGGNGAVRTCLIDYFSFALFFRCTTITVAGDEILESQNFIASDCCCNCRAHEK